MKLLNIFFIFSPMFFIPSSYCMKLSRYYQNDLPELMYPLSIQPFDYEIETYRSLFESCPLHTLFTRTSNIQLMGTIDYNDDYYRCFQFAIEMITGDEELSRKIKFPGFFGSIVLKNFFKQAREPENGDIAVYEGGHFAYVLDKNWFLSKLGANPHIVKHHPAYTPKGYGNSFFILRLKEKYRNDRKLLSKDIKTEIEKK